MRTFSDFYFLLFYFWFRSDLLTKRRENKALKALGAITVIQGWVVLGGYWWAEMLLRLPSPPRSVFFMAAVALFAVNWAILQRGHWEQFENRFVQMPPRARQGWMAVAAATSIAAFALLFSAAVVSRSGGD